MEGVGARLGRSSTRYGGPTTVFSGPVRKWKKKWVHVSPSAASNNNNNHNHNHHSQTTTNGTNGNNGSHLLFYKWTPNSQTNGAAAANNSNSADKTPVKENAATDADEPPRRKFKYIPIAMLEDQKNEAAEMVEDEEAIPEDSDIGTAEPSTAEPTPKSNDFDEKPDINDMPTEETEAPDNQIERQDLNESTLDLSLGLTAHDGDHDSDSKTDQIKDGQLERVK